MNISIQVKNIKEALKKFDSLKKDLEQPFREVILGSAQLIRGEAIKDIQTGAKSGRIYEKVVWRRTKCLKCGQWRADKTFESDE